MQSQKRVIFLSESSPTRVFSPTAQCPQNGTFVVLLPAQEASDAYEEKVAEAIGLPAQVIRTRCQKLLDEDS